MVWKLTLRQRRSLPPLVTRRRRFLERFPKEPWVSGELEVAVSRLERIGRRSVKQGVYAPILRRCIQEKAFSYGRRVHAHLAASRYDETTHIANLLAEMYCVCGRIECAEDVFTKMRGRMNTRSWNLLIGAYWRRRAYDRAFWAFRFMQGCAGVPDCSTYTMVLDACCKLGYAAQGILVHHEIMKRRLEQSDQLQSTVLTMYGRLKKVRTARLVFEDAADKTTSLWNAMLTVYVRTGHHRRAVRLFTVMLCEGAVPDGCTLCAVVDAYAGVGKALEGVMVAELIVGDGRMGELDKDEMAQKALIKAYSRCGMVQDAKALLQRMPKVVFYRACISILGAAGRCEDAIAVFHDMKREEKQEYTILIPVLRACDWPEMLSEGRAIHARLVARNMLPHRATEAALVVMYSRCGSLTDARLVFDKMGKRKTVAAWNALIRGYARAGHCRESLELFRRMHKEADPREKPEDSTLACVFSACCAEETYREGKEIHACVEQLPLSLQTSNAILEMYARRGAVSQAKEVFDRMHGRDSSSWTSLISAYASAGYRTAAIKLLQALALEGLKVGEHGGALTAFCVNG